MYIVVTSTEDSASINIREQLLHLAVWENMGDFKGMPVLGNNEMYLVTNDRSHIFAEGLDLEIREKCGLEFQGMIFASRHSAESGVRSLTVHPIGNFSEAKFGGRDRTLVPSMPHEMTYAYRRLLVNGKGLNYEITFEATHHGPYVETPTMFIEIGSDEKGWSDERAGMTVAKTIMEIPAHKESKEVLVGVGGGHYCPRHTDIMKNFDVAFGHIIPGWALNDANDLSIMGSMSHTPDAEKVYFHRKAMKGALRRRLEELFTNNGYEIIRTRDLEGLELSNQNY